jgi:uncharacterized tellurite resistance protein B-like protein
MSIFEMLGLAPRPSRERADALTEAVERQVERLDGARARFVSAFAGLLAHVADADERISDAEVAAIARLIAEHSGLSSEEAPLVAAIVKAGVFRDTERRLLIRHVNEVASDAEKARLIECLYAVACADELVAFVEDREVRKIADALLVPWSDVQKIRSRYRDNLEELRELRRLRRGPG